MVDTAFITITPDEGVNFEPRAAAQAESIAVALFEWAHNVPIQTYPGVEHVDLAVTLVDSRNGQHYIYWFVKH